MGGEPTGSIGFSVSEDYLRLDYRARNSGQDDWSCVVQTLWLDRTPCHFGRDRAWFLRPRCNRRVAVLCGLSTHFWCRHCYQLPYDSQRESYSARMIRKARKLRARLGADENLTEPVWVKPKGMHWRTFERLCVEDEAANAASWSGMAGRSDLFERS